MWGCGEWVCERVSVEDSGGGCVRGYVWGIAG